MLIHPNFDPVIVSIYGLQVRWYGVCYLLGFLFAYLWLLFTARQAQYRTIWSHEKIIDLLIYVAVGVILGGRAGYVIFYAPELLLTAPLELFKFWQLGRSFHAGVLGVVIALLIFCKVHKLNFWQVSDFLVPAIPIGIFFGRMGNFINGELWGRVASDNLPWAMVFPHVDLLPRHPSQLYEAGLEGVSLFLILFWFSRQSKYIAKPGIISAVFLFGYGGLRLIAELFREPDSYFLGITMGQFLSILMLIIGAYLFYASIFRTIKKHS